MAGMEIFGWLTFVLAISYYFRTDRPHTPVLRDIWALIPWKACFLLLGITAAGLIIQHTEKTEFLEHLGSQRWMFLFFSSAIAITVFPPTQKTYCIFLMFISMIAVYALFQSVTGIDLLRPGSHRAVQPLGGEADRLQLKLWRSAGLFGSPLGYAYIAGQHVCFALAVTLLAFRRQRGWISWASLTTYVLVSASLITTFTRGVWIAMTLAHLTVALLISRRLAGVLLGAGAATVVVLFTTVETFRARLLTLFDTNYASNSERLFLWRANWEMFKDHPILGIGYQENENRAREYVTRLGRPDAFTGHAHNNYLQMLSGTGITGFATWMFIISFMLWLNWKLVHSVPREDYWTRALGIGCFGAQLTLHIGGFTECNFKAGATSHNTIMVWALVVALSTLHRGSQTRA